MESPEIDEDRLGIAGLGWGGRITWLYAAHAPKVKDGLAWLRRHRVD